MRILNINPQRKISVAISEAMLSPTCTLWQTPATFPPTGKRADKNNYIPPKAMAHFFSHPNPNSVVVDAANTRSPQTSSRFYPMDKESERLDLLSGKSCSAALQFCIASFQALMVKYDFPTYSEFTFCWIRATVAERSISVYHLGGPISCKNLHANVCQQSLVIWPLLRSWEVYSGSNPRVFQERWNTLWRISLLKDPSTSVNTDFFFF